MKSTLSFELPSSLRATTPPEKRGLRRDQVRLMVAKRNRSSVSHTRFDHLPDFAHPGDVLVVNNSGTVPAAVEARIPGRPRPEPVAIAHFSTLLHRGSPGQETWVVELRQPDGRAWAGGRAAPHELALGHDGSAFACLEHPYSASARLWAATVTTASGQPLIEWLGSHGRPVRYSYVPRQWPLEDYQTIFARDPGSAEMPSAARPFSAQVVLGLLLKGALVCPVTLHTGVSSLEAGEAPYPERCAVPATTARLVNEARSAGGRVIAVGTTVVRALETAFDHGAGRLAAFEGWADCVVTPDSGVAAVDGLITGWHEPEASHLLLLEAIAGRELLEKAYRESLALGYLWHEFGDSVLFAP